MLQHERLKAIMSQVRDEGKVEINELSEQFGVSKVTIRKDLDILQDQGSVLRYYGGAMPTTDESFHSHDKGAISLLKKQSHVKDRLAKKAAAHVENGDAIFLGSGVTCTLLAEYLEGKKNLTVITNNISAIPTLIKYVERVVIIGGEIITVDDINYFSWTDNPSQYLDNIFVNKVFTSCTGVDFKAGLTVNAVVSTYLFKCLPGIKREWFLLVDADKFNKMGVYQFSALNGIDHVISDEIPKDYIDYFESQNIGTEIC